LFSSCLTFPGMGRRNCAPAQKPWSTLGTNVESARYKPVAAQLSFCEFGNVDTEAVTAYHVLN
jgi:hypothetical protein